MVRKSAYNSLYLAPVNFGIYCKPVQGIFEHTTEQATQN